MFPKRITANVDSQQQAIEGTKMRKMMTVMAWFCLIAGAILSIVTIGSYSDKNLILMIGIGFLIASVHIYVIGLFMALMFKAPEISRSSGSPELK